MERRLFRGCTVSTPILIISTKLAVHQHRHNLATKYHQVNLEKESQKILVFLKPEKAALTELLQYYEEHIKKKAGSQYSETPENSLGVALTKLNFHIAASLQE